MVGGEVAAGVLVEVGAGVGGFVDGGGVEGGRGEVVGLGWSGGGRGLRERRGERRSRGRRGRGRREGGAETMHDAGGGAIIERTPVRVEVKWSALRCGEGLVETWGCAAKGCP